MMLERISEALTPRLGVALSGGGARGLAHLGVLKALEEAGFRIDYLAGTSMGALVAAGYALGYSPDELAALAVDLSQRRNLFRIADVALDRGLLRGERLHALLLELTHGATFADLRLPLTVVAVDLESGEEVHFTQGRLADALRASISLPGLLAPLEWEGRRLVDGGLLNDLPVDVVRQMGADVVLAVDVSPSGRGASFWHRLGQTPLLAATVGGLLAVLGDALDLVMHKHSLYKLRAFPPDFLLQPVIPPDVSVISGYNRVSELFHIGMESAIPVLPQLRDALRPSLPLPRLRKE